jgi:hypothetical protein
MSERHSDTFVKIKDAIDMQATAFDAFKNRYDKKFEKFEELDKGLE